MSTKLYVGNIPYQIPEAEFRCLFENFGTLVSCTLKDGYAFVEYESLEIAEEAQKAMHEKDLDGRILRVELSRPEAAGKLKNYDPNRMETKNLFIANIPNDATKEDVEDAFGKFGKVMNVKILSPRPNATALSGFVDFEQLDDAISAHNGSVMVQENELRTDYNKRRRPEERRGGFGRDDRRGGGRGYGDDRRGGYDDRRGGYDDRRGGYDDRRGGYDDRRGGYDDRRGGYDDRRGGPRGYDDDRQGGGRGFNNDRRGGDGFNGDRRGGRVGFEDDRRGGGRGFEDAGRGGGRGFEDAGRGGRGGFEDGRTGGRRGFEDNRRGGRSGFEDDRRGGGRGFNDDRSGGFHDDRHGGRGGFNDGRRGGGFGDDRRGRPEPRRSHTFNDRPPHGGPPAGYDDRRSRSPLRAQGPPPGYGERRSRSPMRAQGPPPGGPIRSRSRSPMERH